MRRFTILPRSLPGQIALLVAVTLFVAQAINFGLILRERRMVRFVEFTLPAVTRIVDAAERYSLTDSPPPGARRGRFRMVEANPVPPGLARSREFEASLSRALAESGVTVGHIVAGYDGEERRRPARALSPRTARGRQLRGTLEVGVELPGRGWLAARVPWPRSDWSLIWRLMFQTAILYFFTLIPVLWIGNRISRPLRSLAASARDFRPGETAAPLEERGPGDVRAVIAAYNALGLRVNAMLDEKDRMLGALGHDLRTPLAALRVRIESVEDDQERQRMAEIIHDMDRTLDDILSLARLGRPSEAVTEVHLSALIDAVVEDFRDLGADVAFDEPGRLTLALRPTLMRRAVRNLIENAVKYAGSAEVALVADGGFVEIQVSDHGPGIPEADMEAVFDPFTRLERSRNRDTGGIGLGLALARAIVRDAGGEIGLANRPGGGLTATIRLPR